MTFEHVWSSDPWKIGWLVNLRTVFCSWHLCSYFYFLPFYPLCCFNFSVMVMYDSCIQFAHSLNMAVLCCTGSHLKQHSSGQLCLELSLNVQNSTMLRYRVPHSATTLRCIVTGRLCAECRYFDFFAWHFLVFCRALATHWPIEMKFIIAACTAI